jgi:hypothetical protein
MNDGRLSLLPQSLRRATRQLSGPRQRHIIAKR